MADRRSEATKREAGVSESNIQKAREFAKRFEGGYYADPNSAYSRYVRSRGGSTMVNQQPQPQKQPQKNQRANEIRNVATRGQSRYRQEQERVRTASQQSDDYDSLEDIGKFTGRVGTEFYNEAKNFVLSGIEQETKYGQPSIITSKGIVTQKRTDEINKFVKGNLAKDTTTEKVMSGRLSEIKTPEAIGAGLFYGLTLGAGGVAKGARGASRIAIGISERTKIGQIEKNLNIPKSTEKIGPRTYLSGGGVESNPKSLFVTRFGKKQTVEEIRPIQSQPSLTPKEINIRGSLDPTSRLLLEAKQTGPFTFKSELPSSSGRRTYAKGVFDKQIKPIGESTTVKVNDITKQKTEALRQSLQQPKTVYGETRAEKFDIMETARRESKKGLSFASGPSGFGKIGVGSTGRAKAFTTQETKSIKEMVTPPKQIVKEKDILFSSPRFITPSLATQQAQSQSTVYPSEKTVNIFTNVRPPKNKETAITSQTPPITTQPQIEQGQTAQLIPPVTKQPPAIKITPTSKLGPPTQIQPPFQIITPKQIQPPAYRTSSRYKPPPEQQSILTRPPTIPPPLEPPIRIPKIIGVPPFPIGSRDFDTPDRSIIGLKGWMGNTREDSIIGLYKGFDIKYGGRQPKGKKQKSFSITNKPLRSKKSRNVSITGKGKKIKIF